MTSIQYIKTMEKYRDQSYVLSILYQRHSNFYNTIKNIINLPLIITSSLMSIINSNFQAEDLKIINITVNCLMALLLSLMNNFKIYIKAQIFHNLSQKMNRLCHKIESVLSDNIEGITSDMIEGFINEYDNLNESLEFGLIDYINNKVKDLYKDVKTLPSSLNCIGSFVADSATCPNRGVPSDIVIVN
jgi:hypothetical protein